MKDGWETRTLAEICTVDWGNTNLTKSAYVEDGEFLAVSAAGCDGRIGHSEHKRFTPVLSAIGAQCGRMFFPEEDFTAIKNTITLTPIEGTCDSKFLYHLLTFVTLPQRGAGQPFISKGDIQSFTVSIPPIEEQRRIVAILDEAFAYIDKAKANTEKTIQNARELFDSYLNNIFSNPAPDWERRTLKELTSKIGSGATPRGGKMAYKTSGISLIRSMNVHDRRFKPDNLAFIDSNQADELSNVTLQQSDVLINITGASIARSCVCPEEILPARVNQHVSIVRPRRENIDPGFLNYSLTSSGTKDRLLNVGVAGGSTRQALTKADLESFEIDLPSAITEQQAISSKLGLCETETKELDSVFRAKIAELEELKRSILQKAFSGELLN
jgi:type I restriction enzyme S subunit